METNNLIFQASQIFSIILLAHSEEDDVPLEKSAKLLNKISKMDKGGKNQEQGPTPEAEPNKSLSIKYKANPINQEYEDDYTAQEESEQIPETKPKENQKNQLDYGGYYKPQDPSRQ